MSHDLLVHMALWTVTPSHMHTNLINGFFHSASKKKTNKPLCGCPILSITRMIIERIILLSVLLPLFIVL